MGKVDSANLGMEGIRLRLGALLSGQSQSRQG